MFDDLHETSSPVVGESIGYDEDLGCMIRVTSHHKQRVSRSFADRMVDARRDVPWTGSSSV